MTIYRSDFETVGFRRSEIIPFLRRHNIDIPSSLEELIRKTANTMQRFEAAEPAPPDWRELVGHWSTLTTENCAEVMLDLNPAGDRGYAFYDHNEEFHTWRRTIEDACASGALLAQGRGGDWRIAPADLVHWCDSYRYPCPLRLPRDTSHDDRSEAECDRLRQEVKRLQAELQDVAQRLDESGRDAKTPPYLDPAHDTILHGWPPLSAHGTPSAAEQSTVPSSKHCLNG